MKMTIKTLEGMTDEEFFEWKKQHLNGRVISKESLLAIRLALDLSRAGSKR